MAGTATTRPRAPRKPRTTAGTNKGGRPSAIDRTLTLPNGQTTTVGDRIVELMRVGAYAERAARASGVPKSTFYGWLECAQMARERAAADPAHELTQHEQACVRLSDAVEEAEATYEMTALAALERIGQGGVNLTTTIEKYDSAGNLLERTTKVTGLAPNAAAITWKLTRRFPERYQLHDDTGAASQPAEGGLIDLTPAAITSMVNDVELFAHSFEQ